MRSDEESFCLHGSTLAEEIISSDDPKANLLRGADFLNIMNKDQSRSSSFRRFCYFAYR